MVRVTRVLLVGKGSPEKGGIATFLEMLMSSSLHEEFDLKFLNLARPLGGRMGRLSLGNIGRTLADTRAVFEASRTADVVHIHTAFVPAVTIVRSGILALSARLAGAKVVVHVHGGLFPGWLDSGGSVRLVSAALRPAHSVIAVSVAVHERLGRILGGGTVSLIHNGVETDRFLPSKRPDSGPPTIGYVGFITRRKGLLDLYAASEILDERGVPHRISVIGGTPTEGEAEAQEIRSKAPTAVRFVGQVDRGDIPEWYSSFDVFCLPSWWEAAPLSVLEAMSAGLAVVATDVGDIPTMVEDRVNGLLVPPGSPDVLAAALQSVLVDPLLAAEMGRAGRQKAIEQFDWRVALERIAGLYRDVA